MALFQNEKEYIGLKIIYAIVRISKQTCDNIYQNIHFTLIVINIMLLSFKFVAI